MINRTRLVTKLHSQHMACLMAVTDTFSTPIRRNHGEQLSAGAESAALVLLMLVALFDVALNWD
jgi:hypothetical protein